MPFDPPTSRPDRISVAPRVRPARWPAHQRARSACIQHAAGSCTPHRPVRRSRSPEVLRRQWPSRGGVESRLRPARPRSPTASEQLDGGERPRPGLDRREPGQLVADEVELVHPAGGDHDTRTPARRPSRCSPRRSRAGCGRSWPCGRRGWRAAVQLAAEVEQLASAGGQGVLLPGERHGAQQRHQGARADQDDPLGQRALVQCRARRPGPPPASRRSARSRRPSRASRERRPVLLGGQRVRRAGAARSRGRRSRAARSSSGELLGLGVEEGAHRGLGVDDQRPCRRAAARPRRAAPLGRGALTRGDLLVEVAARRACRRPRAPAAAAPRPRRPARWTSAASRPVTRSAGRAAGSRPRPGPERPQRAELLHPVALERAHLASRRAPGRPRAARAGRPSPCPRPARPRGRAPARAAGRARRPRQPSARHTAGGPGPPRHPRRRPDPPDPTHRAFMA